MNKFWNKLKYRPELTKSGKKLFFSVIYSILVFYYLWCIPAVYFLNLPWEWLRILLTSAFVIVIPILTILSRKDKRYLWGVAGICLFFGVWFSMLPASNDRDWTPDVARIPIVRIVGDKVIIKNIRNFTYKTDKEYKISYYNGIYDLNDITGADYILSYWDGNTLVAHSMFSFAFKDGRHIAVSVETRREKGEPQTGLRGLYNQYELIYILADESDLFLLRTNYRKEDVFLFPLKPKRPENIKKVFLEIMGQIMKLEKQPVFYNTLKDNCFTTLLYDVRNVTGNPPIWDYRVIFNGLSDQMGYERGWFKTEGLTFSEFKKKHHINQYVQDDPEAKKNFSKKIRNIKE
jgi:hypothetical protein